MRNSHERTDGLDFLVKSRRKLGNLVSGSLITGFGLGLFSGCGGDIKETEYGEVEFKGRALVESVLSKEDLDRVNQLEIRFFQKYVNVKKNSWGGDSGWIWMKRNGKILKERDSILENYGIEASYIAHHNGDQVPFSGIDFSITYEQEE